MNMDFDATVLAELNRRSRIKFILLTEKHRLTDLDSNPVLCCERMAALRLSHGENGIEVPEENPVSVPLSPPQIPVEMPSNRTQTFSV
jgi:hypothetical protein